KRQQHDDGAERKANKFQGGLGGFARVFHAFKVKFSRVTCNSAFSRQVARYRQFWRVAGTRSPLKIKYMSLHTPDLTKFPPRSGRVRLGGYVILPRCLDKGRATLAGKNGEYHFA